MLEDVERPASEDLSPRAELLRERARLRAELRELEFDYQSGKHSESDFSALRNEIQAKALEVIEKLAALPAQAMAKAVKTGEIRRARRRKKPSRSAAAFAAGNSPPAPVFSCCSDSLWEFC